MIAQVLRQLIRLYQLIVSPLLGPRCRFYPSCSEFARECLSIHSLPVAMHRTAGRLLKCHPWHPGGVDLP